MNPIRYIFILLLFINTGIVQAQNVSEQPASKNGQIVRLEIETRQDSEPFNLIPFGNAGMLLFYQSVVATEDKDHTVWIFKLYDVNLNQVWIQELPIIKELKFHKSEIHGDVIYMIFYNEEKSFSGDNVEILKVPGSEGLIRAKTGKIPDKSLITNFSVWRNVAFIGIQTEDDRSEIMKFNMEEGLQQSFSVHEGPLAFLFDMKIDTSTQVLHVLYKDFDNEANEFLFYRRFDMEGDTLLTIRIDNDAGKYLINSGEILFVDDDRQLIIGTYKDNPKGKASTTFEGLDIECSGIYSTKISGSVDDTIKYFNFSQFSSFYKNLSVNDLSRIRKKDKKGDEITIDYNLLVHNIILLEDGYVFVAEAYYPEYHTVTRMMYDWYGRPMPSYYNVFDGYRYTSAFIARFDKDGKMLWDNGLELWDILSNKLENRVNVIFNGNETILAFNHEGEITYKVIEGTEDVQGLDYVQIESKNPRDKLTYESGSNMMYWYKNYFVAYGYQKIRNNLMSEADKRNVFYMNKIAFN
jgi:hypothetical protein